jgi:4-amino-4-deoxy-L-arabinose transferase-like glycosyltransferase
MGTVVLDETAYRAQALTLAAGHLTLPASTHDPSFLPFLSGIRDGRVVFKHEPWWPAVLAASHLLFGSFLPTIAALGMAAALSVYWFAWELLGSRRVAIAATGLFVFSPFVWLQSGTVLVYHFSFILITSASAAMLRASRRSARLVSVVAGVLTGLALANRPFDTLLAVVPVGVFAAWRCRDVARLVRLASYTFAGAAPVLLVGACYHQAVMGALWRLPFGVSGPSDRFGFGWRASIGGEDAGPALMIPYTPALAATMMLVNASALMRVVLGGPILLAAAALVTVARRRQPETWLLAVMTLVVPIGYFFWWGTANSVHFGLHTVLGPFYWYPILLPLAVLGGWGLDSWRPRPGPLLAAGIVAVMWFGIASWPVLRKAYRAGKEHAQEMELYDAPGRRLVLAPGSFPGDPYLRVENRPALDGDLVAALDVPLQRVKTIERFADRALYVVREYHALGDAFGPVVHDRREVHVVRGPRLAFHVSGTLPQWGRSRAPYLYPSLDAGNDLHRAGDPGRGHAEASWMLTPSDVPPDVTVAVAVRLSVVPRDGILRDLFEGESFECRFEVRLQRGGELEAVEPCEGFHRSVYPGGKSGITREEISSILTATVTSVP